MKIFLLFTAVFLLRINSFSQQGVGINQTGAAPHVSAMLDIQSTDKGLLIPRMTQAQKFAISAPATGLMVYQTDGDKGFYYNFSSALLPAWKKVGADALPSGMIVLSETFPNQNLENNGFQPVGAFQQSSVAEYGNNGRWTICNTANRLNNIGTVASCWTGTEALFWNFNDAKKYNPATDAWITIPANASLGERQFSVSLWTGTEMIIWGGKESSNAVATGARYNPATNSWQPMALAPINRYLAKAFWTGTEMIVFGGEVGGGFQNTTGAKYKASTNTWTMIPNAPAMPGGQVDAGFSWTGSKLFVWGGNNGLDNGSINKGAIYDPASNSWTAIPTINAPSARRNARVVWTGTEYLVWGGGHYEASVIPNQPDHYVTDNDGARYNPTTNTWSLMSNSPISEGSGAIGNFLYDLWHNGKWIFYKKSGGTMYSPANNTWQNFTNPPEVQQGNLGPWILEPIGDKIMVWGSSNDIVEKPENTFNVGGVFDPGSNSWVKTIGKYNAPAHHSGHVWTGTEMIVTGGKGNFDVGDVIMSSRYNVNLQGFGSTSPKELFLYKKN